MRVANIKTISRMRTQESSRRRRYDIENEVRLVNNLNRRNKFVKT